MRKTKLSYTKHHLLRNIIRQQAAKAGVCVCVAGPVDVWRLLLHWYHKVHL